MEAEAKGRTKQNNINDDNSPTVPQEKRVVPLLIVWMSRYGDRNKGRQSGTKKWGTLFITFEFQPHSYDKIDINLISSFSAARLLR